MISTSFTNLFTNESLIIQLTKFYWVLEPHFLLIEGYKFDASNITFFTVVACNDCHCSVSILLNLSHYKVRGLNLALLVETAAT